MIPLQSKLCFGSRRAQKRTEKGIEVEIDKGQTGSNSQSDRETVLSLTLLLLFSF